MTDPAIIAASYAAERNYSHNPDDVINASNAVGAWGTAKESTTELVDISNNGNVADIHGAMPTEGFIQGRRFGGIRDCLNCGNDSILNITDAITLRALIIPVTAMGYSRYISKSNAYAIGEEVNDNTNVRFELTGLSPSVLNSGTGKVTAGVLNYIVATYDKDAGSNNRKIFVNGVEIISDTQTAPVSSTAFNVYLGCLTGNSQFLNGSIIHVDIHNNAESESQKKSNFNTLARLPFWSVNYTDYPDNATEYTDNLPYSSSIISSGTFKVDDNKLQCVSAGTVTYSASYEFDGSEYIKVEIGGVEYAGTGTITQGNTTVSVAQGSNKITIIMGTADTINKVRIQFRKEV